MTVPELRVLCKARGLPTYQHKGRRLRKADLVAQLKRVNDERADRRRRIACHPNSSVLRDGELCRIQSRSGRTISSRRDETYETYSVEPAHSIPAKTGGRCPRRNRSGDGDRLIHQLAMMPPSTAETMALYRVLNGTATVGHDGILRRREAKACQVLAERAKSKFGEMKWLNRKANCEGRMMA